MKTYPRLAGDRPSLAPYLEGENFLTLLTGAENTPMQFTCIPERPGSADAVTTCAGSLGTCWATIEEKQREGCGIFVPINALDGDRRAKNVTRLRALFIDVDVPVPAMALLGASMVVHSGRGFHAYWLLDGTDALVDFRPAQKALATYYGSDPVVCDLARLMRLPGTLHLKQELSVRVRLGMLPNFPLPRRTIAEVLALHKLAVDAQPAPRPLPPDAHGNVRKYQAWAATKETTVGCRNRNAFQIAAEGFRRDLPEDAIWQTVEAYCERAGIPDEALTLFRSAARQKRS